MRERVLPFAGTFDIKNSMRSGTKIIVSIPLNESTTDTPL
jgi:signal transduction histidine kinase